MPDINSQTLIKLTQKLVQLPSEAGREKQVAGLLVKEMRGFGYEEVTVDNNGSVVGVINGAQPGPTLLFDGHMDTVGVAPGVPWRHDPFGGEIIEGRLYGRGATDMKGPIAAMIVAVATVAKGQLAGRVVVSASVMEEVLEGVALKAVMDKQHPDYVVICEPSNLRLIHGGRGRAEIHLETIGRPAHSSSPQEGVNAILAMIPAISAIDELPLPTHEIVGHGIMALTDIISEPYPGHSVIPSRCRVTYDRRLMPGETRESVLESLANLPTVEGATLTPTIARGEYQAYTGKRLVTEKWFPAWLFEQSHEFVRKAARGLESVGLPVTYGTYNFCTNAAYSAGQAGVPTIGFGPSPESLAHVVDEYVEVEQLVKTARAYQGIIEAVLGAWAALH
ncbi:MAG: YgeY family selenium metabolism-linked hydrolase [Acidobacteriota bacterium]